MARIGIYGGTFNPPHVGHMQAALEAAASLRLDKLLLIPGQTPLHKQLPEGSADPMQRLEMARLAAADVPVIAVTDMELLRQGPSYTVDTVLQLKKQYPGDSLVLLMGTDMFLGFEHWREAQVILQNAALAVLHRGQKGEREKILTMKEQLAARGASVEIVENAAIAISSTQLRRLLIFRCADPFLPKGVGAYIRENGLYGVNGDYKNLPMDKLEKVVVSLLNPNRVAHVLGCRDTAVALAKHWGADETDAARAGILHDITKAIDGPLQLTLCAEYGTMLSDFSRRYPKTLHALTGSLVAKRVFGENDAVCEAIRHHTTGKGNMNLLEKIIYIADYMEPNRTIPGVEKLRELAFSDIDAAVKLGLEMTLEHLARQGAEVSPESRDALAYLNRN